MAFGGLSPTLPFPQSTRANSAGQLSPPSTAVSGKANLDLAGQHGHLWQYDIVVTSAELAADVMRNCAKNACRIIQV